MRVSSSVVCRVPLSNVKKSPFFRAMVSTIKMGPRGGKWRHTITSTAEKWSALNALAHKELDIRRDKLIAWITAGAEEGNAGHASPEDACPFDASPEADEPQPCQIKDTCHEDACHEDTCHEDASPEADEPAMKFLKAKARAKSKTRAMRKRAMKTTTAMKKTRAKKTRPMKTRAMNEDCKGCVKSTVQR